MSILLFLFLFFSKRKDKQIINTWCFSLSVFSEKLSFLGKKGLGSLRN
jgi:hypothetical protein